MKELLYKLLNLMTLGQGVSRKICGYEMRLPARYYRWFEEDYEIEHVTFINEVVKEAMTVIDIGAHIGFFSIIFAKRVGARGKVIAFEPTLSTYELLNKTIKINKIKDIVKAEQKAVGDRKDTVKFYVTDIEAHNSNSLSNNQRDYGNEHSIEVEMISIDEYVKENGIGQVDFVKIDAEGAEYSVLKGLKNTIDKDKPQIILSLHPDSIKNFGDSLKEIWNYIEERGYNAYYQNTKMNEQYFASKDDLFDVHLLKM